MKAKNTLFLIIASIGLLFDIVLAFVVNSYYAITDTNCFVLYIVSKCLWGLCLLLVTVSVFIRKDTANYIIVFMITAVMQLVPLTIRLLSHVTKGFLVSILIFCVTLIIYLSVVAALAVLSVKTKNATKRLEGSEIEVKKHS